MTSSSIEERMRTSTARLIRKWEALQVELHGFYSTERFAAVNEYCRSTSFWRALVILLLTPLPSLTMAAMVDAMPLEDVEKGFSHSGMVWIRATLATFIYTQCGIEQIRLYCPNLNMGITTGLYISVPVAILTNVLALILTVSICYPLPFASILMAGPWFGFIVFFLVKARGAQLRVNPQAVADVLRFAAICGAQIVIIFIYAGFTAVFTNMSPSYQPVFALIIPVFKIMQKNILSRILEGRDDTKPQVVILNVEISNALFISICMQNSRSIGTSITLILVDLAQAVITLVDLFQMVNSVKNSMFKAGLSTKELIPTAALIFEKISESQNPPPTANLKKSQAWMSSFNSRLSQLTAKKNQVLPTMSMTVGDRKSSPFSGLLAPCEASQAILTSATPLATVGTAEISLAQPTTGLGSLTSREQHQLLKKALQVLFLTEFMLLIEFTEVLVPIIYGGYLVILFHFPNREYYPLLANVTTDELWGMVYSVLGYGLLELGSFVLLVWALSRLGHRFSVHQLAFVMEREFFMVQPKLILWVVFTMQSSLPQMGVDYTFKFAWLRHGNNNSV